MASTALALDGVGVTLRGHFNPSILSPAWLLSQGLVGQAEFDQSSTHLISPELTSFDMLWLECRVTTDTLSFTTTDSAEFERVRDAVVGVLNVLRHTPVSALGINRNVHFLAGSESALHHIGDTLAPKDLWEPALPFPALRSQSIQGARPDYYSGHLLVTVEPSMRVGPFGVYVAYNDHYGLSTVDLLPAKRSDVVIVTQLGDASVEKLAMALDILANQWVSSMKRAQAAIDLISGLGKSL